MIEKNKGKKLYAIFKKEIHKGNAYGFDKIDAIKSHIKNVQLPISNEIINEYEAINAIEKVHFIKSEFVKIS